MAPNVKVLLLEVVVEAAGAGALAEVLVTAPNWNVLPVLGACAEAKLVLVVVDVDQFPKMDFTAGCAVDGAVALEPVEAVPVEEVVKPEKTG